MADLSDHAEGDPGRPGSHVGPGRPPISTEVVDLPGTGAVGYVDLGDAEGYPVLSCHGGLVCGLDVLSADGPARRAGVRIVSPDRPGIGRSARRAGRSVGEWPAVAAALLDQLGVGRFSVLGWSMGAPYGAACAALLGDRVDAATLVAGGVPFDWPCTGGGFANRTDSSLLTLARSRPAAAELVVAASRRLVDETPASWLASTRRTLPAVDVEVIERDGMAAFLEAVSGGLADPAGVVDEFLAYDAPWGFTYEQITVPVHLWHGTDDTLVPAGWSEEAARRLPRATLRQVAGAGHFVARDNWDEIFAELHAGRR